MPQQVPPVNLHTVERAVLKVTLWNGSEEFIQKRLQ